MIEPTVCWFDFITSLITFVLGVIIGYFMGRDKKRKENNETNTQN